MLPSVFDFMTAEEVAGLIKAAEREPIRHPVAHAAKTVGKGLLGFGLGTAGGYAIGSLADKVYEASTGKRLPAHYLVPAASMLGAGMGLAYSLYKSKELEELQRAVEAHRNKTQGSLPRK